LQESFSLSTWEAIAAGRPVCLPRLGTFLSTVGDGALYHEPADDAGLAANILRYVREPELAAAHCRKNWVLAKAYDRPHSLAKMRAVYLSLLEG
jgi:glycosyltransferase involved in cell wall biosynthesis